MTIVYDFEKYKEEGVVDNYTVEEDSNKFDLEELRTERSVLKEGWKTVKKIKDYVRESQRGYGVITIYFNGWNSEYVLFTKKGKIRVEGVYNVVNKVIKLNPEVIVFFTSEERVKSELVYIFERDRVKELKGEGVLDE